MTTQPTKEEPALNPHIAHTLLDRTPAHAWLKHRLMGGKKYDPTRAMDVGQLIHALLLGKGNDIVEIDANDYRTDKAREARDAAHAAGKTPVLVRELDELHGIAAKVRHKLQGFDIVLDGESERKIEWREQYTGVLCRGVLDHNIGGSTIFELKTSKSAKPSEIERQIYTMGYDIQMAAYTQGLVTLDPKLAGRIDFVWLFVEMSEPYCVTPVRPDGALRELGSSRWDRAAHVWAKCLRSNHWPEYVTKIGTVSPPKWAMAAEIEAEVEAA